MTFISDIGKEPDKQRSPVVRPGYKSFLGVVLAAVSVPFIVAVLFFGSTGRSIDAPTGAVLGQREAATQSDVVRFMANLETRYLLIEYFQNLSPEIMGGQSSVSANTGHFERATQAHAVSMAAYEHEKFGAVREAPEIETPNAADIEAQLNAGGIPALSPIDLEGVHETDRRKLLSISAKDSAVRYQAWLPIEGADGAQIIGVSAKESSLLFVYRVAPSDDASASLAQQIRRDICLQSAADPILQLGGVYEYKLMTGQDHVLDHFQISAYSCS